MFQCSTLVVGAGVSGIQTEVIWEKGNRDLATGNRKTLVALSKEYSKTLSQKNSTEINDDVPRYLISKIKEFILFEIRRSEQPEFWDINSKWYKKKWDGEVTRYDIRVFDINGDGEKEYIVSAYTKSKHGINSIFVALNYLNGKVVPLQMMTERNREGSWGIGYEFIDAVNVIDNQISELIIKSTGWETTSFHIFKLEDGLLIELLTIHPYGC